MPGAVLFVAFGLLGPTAIAHAQQGVTQPVIAPAAAPPPPAPNTTATTADVGPTYVIGSDDSLQVTVWKEPNLSGTLLVRPDGMITLPLVGDVLASGMTPAALGKDLAAKLKKFISDPLVAVIVVAVNSKRVYLLGEVARVGPLSLSPGLTPLQAIAEAGGLSPYAHAKDIYILRMVNGKQQKIAFNYKKALKTGDQQSVSLLPGDTIVVPMKPLAACVAVIAVLHACPQPVFAQATPAARSPLSYVGLHLPRLGGNLQYSLSASETVNSGYYGMNSTASYTTVSGSLSYLSTSQARPFSFVYSGGYLGSTSGQPSSAFHNLAFVAGAYGGPVEFRGGGQRALPSPKSHDRPFRAAGLGDLGLSPGQIISGYGQGLLTSYATRVDNTASGSAQRRLGGSNLLSGSATWIAQRFVGASTGFASDNDLYAGTGAFTHRIDSLNSVSAGYTFTRSSFVGTSSYFQSQSVNLQYTRRWSRTLAMDLAAGPQYTSGTYKPALNYTVNGSVTYTGERLSAAASYLRSLNNGSGVILGARNDSASATASRSLGRSWSTTGSFIFSRTQALDQTPLAASSAHTVVGSFQLSRQLGRSLSTYASYTLQRQTTGQNALPVQAFSGTSQIIGFGITYAPRAIRLDR